MPNQGISVERILSRLDEHLHKNDYASAERHLLYWLSEATASGDFHAELPVRNELMGLYRKLGRREEALSAASIAVERVNALGIAHQVGAATTLLNAATVCKAFGKAEESIPMFEAARTVYERELSPTDGRLGGLYNNMALALTDLSRFSEARELYRRAIAVMEQNEGGETEIAITYLNLADVAEAELGALEGSEEIEALLDRAEALLEQFPTRDGYYAFVCEKCASVFGYYGRFVYEKELSERARRIYEGS